MSKPATNEEESLLQQTQAIHAAVAKRLSTELWNGLEVQIDAVPRDVAFLGTITALLHEAMNLRALWLAMAELDGRELPNDREAWLQIAGDCYNDAERAAEAILAAREADAASDERT